MGPIETQIAGIEKQMQIASRKLKKEVTQPQSTTDFFVIHTT
jgi:hypothetical protein